MQSIFKSIFFLLMSVLLTVSCLDSGLDDERDRDREDGDADSEIDGDYGESSESQDSPDEDPADGDSDGEMTVEEEAELEEENDSPPLPDPAEIGNPFEPDQLGVNTQLHPSAVFDGEGIWVAYSLPNDVTSNFDTWALRLKLDGSPWVAPFKVNTSEANNLDPALAVSDGRLLIVWQADTGEFNEDGVGNMVIFYRLFTVEGEAINDVDIKFDPSREGQKVAGNKINPMPAPLPGCKFKLAGSRGLDSVRGWQVFLHEIDCQGLLSGEPLDVDYDPDATQMYSSIAPSKDGGAWLGYIESPQSDLDMSRVYLSELASDGTLVTAVEVIPDTQSNSIHFSTPGASEAVYLGMTREYGGASDILITRVDLDERPNPLSLSENRAFDHSPIPAGDDSQGAVIWHRMTSGYKSNVMLQAFAFKSGQLSAASKEVQLNYLAAAGYFPTDLVYVGDSTYFAIWSEGANPNFRLKARFIRF